MNAQHTVSESAFSREELIAIVEEVVKRMCAGSGSNDQYVRQIDACHLTGFCAATLRKWEREGRLRSHGQGRNKRYLRTELLAAVDGPKSESTVSDEDARRFAEAALRKARQ